MLNLARLLMGMLEAVVSVRLQGCAPIKTAGRR